MSKNQRKIFTGEPLPQLSLMVLMGLLLSTITAVYASYIGPEKETLPFSKAPLPITETAKLTASDAAIDEWFGRDVDIDEDTIVVGKPHDDANGNKSGAAYIFQASPGQSSWNEIKKLVASDVMNNARFGRSVAISQDIVTIGAWGDSNDSGAVYIFQRDLGGPNNWGEMAKLTASDGGSGDRFGWSIDNDGDTVVVGAYGDGASTGAAYVFQRHQGGPDNWGQVKKLTASDAQTGAHFGSSVSVSGSIISIGAPQGDGSSSGSGAAYIFERDQGGPNNWGEVTKLTASDGVSGDRFGQVSIDGNVIIVGARNNDQGGNNAGAAYIFERDQGGPNNWGEVTKLTASDPQGGDNFGHGVTISASSLLVSAPHSSFGAVYMFERDQGGPNNWGEVTKLTASDAEAGDNFGESVSIDTTTAVVGAYHNDDACPSNPDCNSGSAYVFQPLLDVTITKQAVRNLASPGDMITYTLSFYNQGLVTATNTIITDVIPAIVTNPVFVNSGTPITPTGTTPFTWQVAELPPGAGGIITVTGVISPALNSELTFTNTALITTTSELTLTNNIAQAAVTINIPPTLEVTPPTPIFEGDGLTLTGTINDPGASDTFTLQIDWGDGLTETMAYPAGTAVFTETHLYLDDNPTATPTDTYTITLHLADSDNGTDTATTTVTVHNVPPLVDSGPDQTSVPDQPITFTGSFIDPGTMDTFTIHWDFGDGVTTTGTLTPTHLYPGIGVYTATLTITDDDSGVGQDTAVITIQPGVAHRIFLPFITVCTGTPARTNSHQASSGGGPCILP